MGRMRKLKVGPEKQPHWCFPLVDPTWVASGEAHLMRADDPVVGLEFEGKHWALPWWIMKNHHIANLVLQGRPLLVTLCEVCSAAGAFDPVVDGRRLTFKLGGLYNGTIMPLDHETGSLWTGFSGTALEGPMTGRVLIRHPVLQCTWAEWLEMHPGTLVPDGKGESRGGHGEGNHPGSPWIGPDMGDLVEGRDRRLPHHELVLGVLVDGEARCYPLKALEKTGQVVNDTVAAQPIAVFSRPGSWMACAYSRILDGHALTFRTEGPGIVDEQTGSGWQISGVAVTGAHAGRQLRYVNSGVEEFFLWSAFHPQTSIHGVAGLPRIAPGVRWSILDTIPKAVYDAIDSGWLPKRARILVPGCGNGVIAALLAEDSYDVLGIDQDAENIAEARRSFRGMPGLRLETMQLAEISGAGEFAAILDVGFFDKLREDQSPAYAAALGGATRPGARLLVITRANAGEAKQRADQVAGVFGPSFRLAGHSQAVFPGEAEGTPAAGVAVRLERA